MEALSFLCKVQRNFLSLFEPKTHSLFQRFAKFFHGHTLMLIQESQFGLSNYQFYIAVALKLVDTSLESLS